MNEGLTLKCVSCTSAAILPADPAVGFLFLLLDKTTKPSRKSKRTRQREERKNTRRSNPARQQGKNTKVNKDRRGSSRKRKHRSEYK